MKDQQDAGLTISYLDHKAVNLESFFNYIPKYFIIPGIVKINQSISA